MVDCDVFEKPPNELGPPILVHPQTGRQTLLATPRGDERLVDDTVHQTFTLQQAVDRLSAGMTIRMLAGKYYRAVDLVGKHGTAQDPIVIEGTIGAEGEKRSHICGTNAAGSIYPDLPKDNDYAFFKLRNCRHITVSNLRVESCWPSFVYAGSTNHITLDGIDGQDGSYLLFVRGPDAHDVTIVNCQWEQDPTGTIWSDIDWEHSHHGPYAYYNGALAGGVDVRGNIEVAGNHVRNAYNGVRFTTTDKREDRIFGRFNINARIYGNRFINIRDNAIEPEQTCLNWHVFDNQIKNTHAAFSIHNLHGGFIYIYGNRLWFDDRGGADYQDNRGGKIYKLHRKGPFPRHPIHVFHNSILSRTFLIKKARTRLFHHRSNAIQFCDPSDYEQIDPCLCRADRAFLRQFPIDADENPIPWDNTVVFDNDTTNKPFGDLAATHQQERNGEVVRSLGFADPQHGDFTLTADSPLRHAALPFTLQPAIDHPGDQPWTNAPNLGQQPHIGAHQEQGSEIKVPFTKMPINGQS